MDLFDKLGDDFSKACAKAASEGVKQLLKQISDEQLMNIGREVVSIYVRGSLAKELGRMASHDETMVTGAAMVQQAHAIMLSSGLSGNFKSEMPFDDIADALQAKAEKEEQEEQEDEVPTDAGQPLFSAEEVCEQEGGAQ